MSKITKFDKPVFAVMRAEIESALKPVSERYGINIRTGNISYSANQCSIKLECSVLGEDGDPVHKEADTFLMWADLLGMKKEDLNKKFRVGTKEYILIGYAPRKSKYPFVVKSTADGKMYGLAESSVKKALGYTDSIKNNLQTMREVSLAEVMASK